MEKLHIPPLDFGYLSTYWDNRSFSLAGLGKHFHFTPRIAQDYQSNYVNKGCATVNINAGYASGPNDHPGEYTPLARVNRSVFLGPEHIQDSLGGKHFADTNLTDARTAANYAYNRANGYGVITSGAQEGRFDNDYWTQDASVSATAFKNFAIAWGEIQTANPGFLCFNTYNGILYFNVADNPATLRTAVSSNANALAFMQANVYGPNPYFRSDMELWRYIPPLLNLYFRSYTDLHAKLFEIRMAIKLTKMALAACGASWPVMGFVFSGKTEFVSYSGQGYSEKYSRDLNNGGGKVIMYNFPDYSHAFQIDQTFSILDKAEHYYGWEDTHEFGKNATVVHSNVVRDSDSLLLQGIEGSTSGVTQVGDGPTPYNAASTYPYPSTPEGHSDLAPIGAEWYAAAARHGGQNSQLARSRRTGTSTWNSLNSGSEVDRYVNREPYVDVARTGDNVWVKVSDYVSEPTGPYDMDVDVGSGQKVTISVEPGMPTVGLFTSSDLSTYVTS